MQECIEALGGVGYMDDPDDPDNMARRAPGHFPSTPIWEGTTNVLSSELVRHLLSRNHLEHMHCLAEQSHCGPSQMTRTVDALQAVLGDVCTTVCGRTRTAFLTCCLLAATSCSVSRGSWSASSSRGIASATRTSSQTRRARRSILKGEGGFREWLLPDVGQPATGARFDESKERAEWDCRLVWGKKLPDFAPFGQRIPHGSKM